MNATKAKQLAEAGAAILDEKQPGWRQYITQPLNVRDPLLCPIGQIAQATATSFTAAATRFGVVHELYKYGFGITSPESETDETSEAAFVMLTRAWGVIVRRKNDG